MYYRRRAIYKSQGFDIGDAHEDVEEKCAF
jgi:hypothetical protein